MDNTLVPSTSTRAFGFTRVLLGVNAGNAIEFYDWMAYALLVPYFGAQFFPHQNAAAVMLSSFAVFAVGSLARPVGAIVLGRFIDRHGRRSGLLVSVTLMVAASFGIALLPAYASIGLLAPLLLVVLRLVQGFALGPELGGSATYLAESAPEGRRGLFASTYQSSVALGTLAVAGLISVLEVFLDASQMESFGWRIVFAVGGLVALGGLALRRTLPETDRALRRRTAPQTTFLRPVAQLSPGRRADPDHRRRRARRHVRAYLSAPLARPDVYADHEGAGGARQHDRVGGHAGGLASPRPLVRSHRPGVDAFDCSPLAGLLAIPVMASLDGSVGHQLVAQLLGVLLMCTWAAGAFSAFPEMLPLAARAAGIAAPYGVAAAVVGGFSPMVATSFAASWGLVAVGCMVAVMTTTAGVATIGMEETACLPLRVE